LRRAGVASVVEGYEALQKKFEALTSPKDQAKVLRASVREPMKDVQRLARANLSKISPGARDLHRTYKGRLVSRGYASRNMRLIVSMSKDMKAAFALLGVRAEAYYVLQFFERGTATIPKQPWLWPAFIQSTDSMIRRVGEVMLERIEKVAKSRG
jgi:hypothetical protein